MYIAWITEEETIKTAD